MFPRLLRLKLIDCFLSMLDLFIDVIQVLIWCHFLTFVEFYILAKYFVKEMISKYEASKVLCIFRAWKLNKHFESIILCSKALQILFICYRWHWTYYSCSDTYIMYVMISDLTYAISLVLCMFWLLTSRQCAMMRATQVMVVLVLHIHHWLCVSTSQLAE